MLVGQLSNSMISQGRNWLNKLCKKLLSFLLCDLRWAAGGVNSLWQNQRNVLCFRHEVVILESCIYWLWLLLISVWWGKRRVSLCVKMLPWNSEIRFLLVSECWRKWCTQEFKTNQPSQTNKTTTKHTTLNKTEHQTSKPQSPKNPNQQKTKQKILKICEADCARWL